ncbi:MAG: hypothetical protein R2695_07590 [Acidimicrobiales bacterium]
MIAGAVVFGLAGAFALLVRLRWKRSRRRATRRSDTCGSSSESVTRSRSTGVGRIVALHPASVEMRE